MDKKVTDITKYKSKDRLLKDMKIVRPPAVLSSIDPDVAENMMLQKQVMESNPVSKFFYTIAKKALVCWNKFFI